MPLFSGWASKGPSLARTMCSYTETAGHQNKSESSRGTIIRTGSTDDYFTFFLGDPFHFGPYHNHVPAMAANDLLPRYFPFGILIQLTINGQQRTTAKPTGRKAAPGSFWLLIWLTWMTLCLIYPFTKRSTREAVLLFSVLRYVIRSCDSGMK